MSNQNILPFSADLAGSGLAQPVLADIALGIDLQVTAANLVRMGMRREDAQQFVAALSNLSPEQREQKRQKLSYRIAAIQGAAAGGVEEGQLVQNEMNSEGLTRMQAEGFVRYAIAAARSRNDPQPLQPVPSDALAGLPGLAAEFLKQGYPAASTADVFARQWRCTKEHAMAIVQAGLALKQTKAQPQFETVSSYQPASKAEQESVGASAVRPDEGRSRRFPFGRLALILSLAAVLAYAITGFVLSARVSRAFNQRQCNAVVTSAETVRRFYPLFLISRVERMQTECIYFLGGEQFFNAKEWGDATILYGSYLDAFPNGVYLQELRPHAARAQLEWGRQQAASGEYEDAAAQLSNVVGEFSDLPEALEALDALPQVYLDWGAALVKDGSFEAALEKFAVARDRYESPAGADAIAQAYVDWGLALAVDGDFEEAQARLQLAQEAGADLSTVLPAFYEGWTASLAADGGYEEAMQVYRQSLLSQAGAQQGITHIHLKWAADLQAQEDFNAALEKLSAARGSPGGASLQAELDAAEQYALSAYSASSGEQASQLIDSAAQSLCQEAKLPDDIPPILGIDSQQILVRIFPLGSVLGAEPGLLATTPGAFHYVVCIQPRSILLETCPYMGGYSVVRKQWSWQAQMYAISDAKLVARTEIFGDYPPACTQTHYFSRGNYVDTLTGPLPVYADLKAWILKRLK